MIRRSLRAFVKAHGKLLLKAFKELKKKYDMLATASSID